MARLIKEIYDVDPLTCLECIRSMRIISFIEEEAVIQKILEHLKLWDEPAFSGVQIVSISNHTQSQ